MPCYGAWQLLFTKIWCEFACNFMKLTCVIFEVK